jgi:hypothetical protein
LEQVIQSSKLPNDEFDPEIEAIKEYLTSTVQE